MVQINLATFVSIAALASVAIVNALPVAPQAGSFEIVERGVTDPELAARTSSQPSPQESFLGGRDLEGYVNEPAACTEDPELVARFGFLKKFIPFLGGRELGMSDDLEVRGSELEEIEDLLSRFYDEGSLDEMD
ncbi:hypothetical protein DFP72DRAFT_1049794 [Ephemerocybe angulata]|uniref:Uncharacterized protein n=1 Tax=Ephemerocybe angulata TaxID=980116 RepID=A0A8H6M0U6_9AGAR|nr:hypothetical protein DFP72DRAFT_1049794 [Tulosesus angulatus]